MNELLFWIGLGAVAAVALVIGIIKQLHDARWDLAVQQHKELLDRLDDIELRMRQANDSLFERIEEVRKTRELV